MKVKELQYNWYQHGSIQDNLGAGEDYYRYVVGEHGVVSIEENEPTNGLQKWNYIVRMESGEAHRVFNPNLVIYYPV